MHGLPHQRMVGNHDVAGVILQAAHRFGEHGGQQIVAAEALHVRRHALAPLLPQHNQRAGKVPAPAHLEHGHGQQRLLEQRGDVLRVEHLEQVFDGHAVLRSQREHDAVVVGAGLQLEIETAAEPFAQRQAPGPVYARAQRRVDHELHAARLVEEPLEDDFFAGGHQADSGQLRVDVGQRLPAAHSPAPQSSAIQAGISVGHAAGGADNFGQVGAQLGNLGGELGRAARGFAQPEGNARRRALGIAHADFAAAHVQDAPGSIAQQKHVAGQALDGEVLVDRADEGLLGLGDDPILGRFGNRSAGSDGRQPGPAAGAKLAVNQVAMQIGSARGRCRR